MTKCAIVGCANDAIYITHPEMCSGIYCRRHFFEVYGETREVFSK